MCQLITLPKLLEQTSLALDFSQINQDSIPHAVAEEANLT